MLKKNNYPGGNTFESNASILSLWSIISSIALPGATKGKHKSPSTLKSQIIGPL